MPAKRSRKNLRSSRRSNRALDPAPKDVQAETVVQPKTRKKRTGQEPKAARGTEETVRKNAYAPRRSERLAKRVNKPDSNNSNLLVSESRRQIEHSTSRLERNPLNVDVLTQANHSRRRDRNNFAADWEFLATMPANTIEGGQTPTQDSTLEPNNESSAEDRTPNWQKLAYRWIEMQPTKGRDAKLGDLAARFESRALYLNKEMLELPIQSAKAFVMNVNKAGTEDNCAAALWTLLDSITKWRPNHRVPSATDIEHATDIADSQLGNEAVLQRTVMISIIDRLHLKDMFRYNCEGQFNIPSRDRLPVRMPKDIVKMPKPDLALFFDYRALTRGDLGSLVPNELRASLFPDDGSFRCFPFLFLEAKRSSDSLDKAYRANLHSASQALYNIFRWFRWMKECCAEDAGRSNQQGPSARQTLPPHCEEDVFFEQVRVFSIALNAQELDVRIHRAEWSADKFNLAYHFEEVISLKDYDSNGACRVVKAIVQDYAAEQLFPVLQGLFKEVSSRFEQLVQEKDRQKRLSSKRGGASNGNKTPKRARSVVSTLSATPLGMQTSFTMSGV